MRTVLDRREGDTFPVLPKKNGTSLKRKGRDDILWDVKISPQRQEKRGKITGEKDKESINTCEKTEGRSSIFGGGDPRRSTEWEVGGRDEWE